MPKKPKKSDEDITKEFKALMKLIRDLLKEEKTIHQIARRLGYSSKVTHAIINVRKLEEKLLKPVLIGVR